MKVYFSQTEASSIVEALKKQLVGRKLGQLVSFHESPGGVRITIQKLGTSYLDFSHSPHKQGLLWELTQEKLSLAHKPFRSEVMGKISKIIQQAGGQVLT